MIFSKRVYLGNSIQKDVGIYRRALYHKKHSLGLYVIAFLENEKRLTIIYNSEFIKKYRVTEALVVGLALGKRESHRVVRDIVEDVLHTRGDLCIWDFFKAEGIW